MITKIKVGSLELTPENGYYIQAIHDLGYATKYSASRVLYSHGAKLGDVYFENKIMSVELEIGGETVAQFIERRSTLYKALTLNEYGDDKLTFEFYMGNNSVVTVQAVMKDIKADMDKDTLNTGRLMFSFETEEPFFKSKQIYQVQFGITKGGGGAIPMTIPFSMRRGSAGYTQISNGGNVFAFPEIYLYGPLTNPVLINRTGGKQIAITEAIGAGDYIYVNTYDRIVKDNENTNKRDKFSGDFIVLNPGGNMFSLASDNPAELGYAKIKYQNYYVSL